MATRLPYYTGEGDIYSQLMRQFQQEVPYYSSPATFGGGYDPTLYSRQPNLNYVPGLLGDTGFSTGGDSSGLLGSPTGSTSGFGGFGGFGGSGVAADGTVSTGFGGLSLSPSGVVSANTVSVPAAMGLGLITGLPLGLIATISNQSANQAAQGLTSLMADTMGINATPAPGNAPSAAAAAGPGGSGGAAAAAAAAAASAAAAAGLSAAAQGAAAQAAADAVVGNNATPAEAAAAGAAAAGQAGLASEGHSISAADALSAADSGIAGLSSGFSDSGTIGGNADAGPGPGSDSATDAGSVGAVNGSDAASDAAAAAASGGDGGGGAGGKIICTKLHELGKMPTEIYEADQAFGAMLVSESPETYNGYACWARHVVRWMGRDDLFGKFVVFAAYHIATPWSKAMAQEMGVDVKAGWFGRQLLKQGLKVCRAIGKMNQDRSVQNV